MRVIPYRSLARALTLIAIASCALALAAAPASASITYKITGKGYGHGIGMSQWGAHGYADHGYKYDYILRHYYQGTTLTGKTSKSVRVNIEDGKNARTSWAIRAGSKYSRLVIKDLSSPSSYVSLSGENIYYLVTSGSDIKVRKGSSTGTVIKSFSGGVKASATAPSQGTQPALVWVVSGSGPFSWSNVRYRGAIEFRPTESTKSKAVNVLNMQYYLYGVVPRESPSSFPSEALKAQAVAARSYAWNSAQNGTELYCTTSSQVYNGHSRMVSGSAQPHEASSTNSAVQASYDSSTGKGKVVTYGSTIVTTYFFASSGGHTANVEDVWNSSARAYLKGVSDPYEKEAAAATEQSTGGYPYAASWHRTLSYGQSTMASKLRSADYSDGDTVSDGISSRYNYSYTTGSVTRVVCNRASSGFVKSVTLYWSNGKTKSVPGSRFRSWFSLKSTKFYISSSGLPSGVNAFEQSDSRLKWGGTWTTNRTTKAYGGSYMDSSSKGSVMTGTFNGGAITVVGAKGPGAGTMQIYIDGSNRGTIDLYASSWSHRNTLVTKTGLDTAKEHTLVLRVTGTKNSRSSGYRVLVDRLHITGTGLTSNAPARHGYQEDAAGITYSGSWAPVTDVAASGGRYVQAGAGDMLLTFDGVQAKWFAPTGPSFGQATVYLDAKPGVLVDLYSATPTFKRFVWESGVLTHGPHTLRIVPAGTQNSASSGTAVGIDQLDFMGTLTP